MTKKPIGRPPAGTKKPIGRPPAGTGKVGEPQRISDYPKLAVTVRPVTRALLNAVATLENRSAWQIVDDSINQYVERMPPPDRHMVESLAKRVLTKAGEYTSSS